MVLILSKMVTWFVLLMLVNNVLFGEGLAADRNHRWSVDEPTTKDVGSTDKEDVEATPLQNASHLQSSFTVHVSSNHSREEDLERKASVKLPVTNQSQYSNHSYGGANVSASKNTANKTALSLNERSSGHSSTDSIRSNISNTANTLNNSQAENVVHTTLCANGSVEKETMRVEVEFASTVLENGLYSFTLFNNNGNLHKQNIALAEFQADKNLF